MSLLDRSFLGWRQAGLEFSRARRVGLFRRGDPEVSVRLSEPAALAGWAGPW